MRVLSRRGFLSLVAVGVTTVSGCSVFENHPPAGSLVIINNSPYPHLCKISISTPDEEEGEKYENDFSPHISSDDREVYNNVLDSKGTYSLIAKLASGPETRLQDFSFEPSSGRIIRVIIEENGSVEWSIFEP